MFKPLALYIGLRYTRAKRRNHFISFISLTSMLGIALGVTALITVLSVMNGFQWELRERILGMASHATVFERGGALHDWRGVGARIERHPQIEGVAPFVRAEGMLTHYGNVHGVIVQGVLPGEEPKVSTVGERMVEGKLNDLAAGEYRIVLGRALAQALQVNIGEKVVLVSPQPTATPAGIIPRLKQFTVSGVFEIGMHDYDAGVALVHMEDAAKMFRITDGVTGLRLKMSDVFAAPAISREIVHALDGSYAVVDWTEYHANFFRALRTEKAVMFVILTLIIAVAAFNIVSTLIMVVNDKQADVAILRTLGLTPWRVMGIFMVQGTVIGLVGTLLGVLGGIWLASNVETIVPAIEQLLNTKFLSPEVYYITELPSDMRWKDVAWISAVAFGLSLLATIYPAWLAGRTQPAEALRYE
jgi:lipoprotein-releasing system permease protein